MQSFLQEYGKIIVSGVIGMICLVILIFKGAFMDAVDQLKPTSPVVKNELTAAKLQGLSKRKKPRIIFLERQIELGEQICISELVTEARDAENRDIKDQVHYYLEDGTEVDKNYSISADRLQVMKFRFYVEDKQGLYADELFAFAVSNREGIYEAKTLIEEWDIGVAEGTVKARMFSAPKEVEDNTGKKDLILAIEGNGTAKSYRSESEVPWLKEYGKEVVECIIEEGVNTPDVSFWFKNCERIQRPPTFYNTFKMESTFENCSSLLYGVVPETVSNLRRTFKGCTKMTAMSEIPSSVNQMEEAFYGCVKLRGDLLIAADPLAYDHCLHLAASQTGGIPLKIYVRNDTNGSTVKEMIMREMNEMNGSLVTYMGIVK